MDDRFHRGGADCRPDSARSDAPLLWFCPRMTQFVGRNRARCCTCDDREHCARHVRGDSSCRLAGSLYQSKPKRRGIGTATLFASAAARKPPGWPHPTLRAVGAASARHRFPAFGAAREPAALSGSMVRCSPSATRIADVRAASTLHTRAETRPFAAAQARPSRQNRQTSPGGMPVRLQTRPRHRT